MESPDPRSTAQPDTSTLSVTVTVAGGDEAQPRRVMVAGEMDGFNGVWLHEAVVDLVRRQRPARLAIDLAGVTFLDSGGIRCLLLCRADAENAGCRMTVVDAHPTAYRILRIMGLLDHLGIAERNH